MLEDDLAHDLEDDLVADDSAEVDSDDDEDFHEVVELETSSEYQVLSSEYQK